MTTLVARSLVRKAVRDLAVSTDSFKVALYSSALDTNILVYTTSGEVSGIGYTAGGKSVTGSVADVGDATRITFSPAAWAGVAVTTSFGLVYRTSDGAAMSILDFGGPQAPGGGSFTLTFPANFIVLTR